MKISSSIRQLYENQVSIHEKLQERVKKILEEGKQDNWFYKDRIKKLESYAQKLETGRFPPNKMEDFFACTIVVENRSAIKDAIVLVEKYCEIKYKKPRIDGETHKYPDVFSFDDLRLYVHLKSSNITPAREFDNIVFEVQIKTFLQHAWSIATHDLIYKGDSISWSKARLAYQIKAMLEHAEISIEQVNEIARSSALNLIDEKTSNLKNILEWLQDTWQPDLLPQDLVRLSNTIAEIIKALGIKLNDIKNAVKKDTASGTGAKSINLSPYEVIIKALCNHYPEKFSQFLNNSKTKSKTKFLITKEMDIDDFLQKNMKDKLTLTYQMKYLN